MAIGNNQTRRGPEWLVVCVALTAIGLAIVAAVLTIQGESQQTGRRGPRLAADTDKIDLGTVPLGQRVKAVFTLTNVGDQPLTFFDHKIPTRLLQGC